MATRNDFLRNMRKSQVKLHPLQLEDWDIVVYLRPQTLGEVRDLLLKEGDKEETLKDEVNNDPLFLARNIARIVRNETGELLFNDSDDEQMQELMLVLENTAPSVSRQINKAYRGINEPNSLEADAQGN